MASFDSWLTSCAMLKQMLGIIERGLQESGNSWCFCGMVQGPVHTTSDQFTLLDGSRRRHGRAWFVGTIWHRLMWVVHAQFGGNLIEWALVGIGCRLLQT